MFGDIEKALRRDLADKDYAEAYASAFLNSYIATQIKVIREQRGLTQTQLGELMGTTQGGVSRYENVNYSSWSLRILKKLANAFGVRLRVSFEPYGTLPDEVIRLDRLRLERLSRERDPGVGVRSSTPLDETRSIDIGAYKAMGQIGQRDNTGRGAEYGDSSNNESEGSRLDGTRLSDQRRAATSGGLHSAAGEQIRFPEVPLQA